MIWTELTKKAYLIACHAHCGQVDKGGNPYIVHPCTLAAQMPTEELATVALLHDVLEDSDVTADDLAAQGIPVGIVRTVVLLTHYLGETYLDYIRALSHNPIAAIVKKADLEHNMDLTRLGHPPTDQDISRQNRYRKALEILNSKS